ncbi:unnamed protein product [Prorocentrum cordatum]|uniref:Uncharacterized protein n=1 Tax=Prorocentrum cordatum TaxID=2364126 RepID=A0ABN9VBH7_9DINO|nr:unnamed protein product [Polarella glacialis]
MLPISFPFLPPSCVSSQAVGCFQIEFASTDILGAFGAASLITFVRSARTRRVCRGFARAWRVDRLAPWMIEAWSCLEGRRILAGGSSDSVCDGCEASLAAVHWMHETVIFERGGSQ